ncbi:cytochrome d ubiquinol oxidase subunit II [Pseudomonas azerbaijanoccidentalis]|uniref:cytochrome d ubiquinol oxidase subunit II n=1 Tax=Pseudomonas azerbaijanoccidentalis TaxID=2842347 RepID=UPI0034629DFE
MPSLWDPSSAPSGFLVVVLYPLIVPPNLTLQAATSSPATQRFMLIGFAVLIPVTLIYNTYGFKVFSGKVHPVEQPSHQRP